MFASDSDGTEQEWQKVRDLLRREVGETAFGTWLKPINLIDREDDQVLLGVPTLFMRDWLIQHYADRIRIAWGRVNQDVRSIVLSIQPPVTAPGDAASNNSAQSAAANAPKPAPVETTANKAQPRVEAGNGQWRENALEEFGIKLDPRMTFESFVVGKPNELAVAAAERVARSAIPPFNPLFLYGGVGLGKTHLMHAIATRAKEIDTNRRVIYLSAEKFMYQFVRSLRQRDTMGFKELFRSVDMLMVDDVQFIGDKDSTQEEFFHTFNTLIERKRQIVISADRSPSDLSSLQERIRSRLGWGLCADIHPTTYELRLGILQTKAEQLKVSAPLRVLEFLASRITSNVRELEGALNRIVHHASLFHRPIALEMAQDVLKDQIRSHDRRVTIDDIQKAVVEHYGIRLADMASNRRQRSVARPRQVAMYLAKKLTSHSLPEIGKQFGKRDHTTVMHAVKKIDELMADDRTIADDVESLTKALKG